MLKIAVKGIKEVQQQLAKELAKEETRGLTSRSNNLKERLRAATPVDTGNARDSWRVEVDGSKATVSSDVEYMKSLNAGHSKQAPSFFIEREVLKDPELVPIGSIVTYR